MVYQAYDFHGGGACPTQFYWHNVDSTKWYYFRFRHGGWFLKEGPGSMSTTPYDSYKVIADGVYGDSMDGYMSLERFIEQMSIHGINVLIITRGEVDDLL